MMNKGLGISCLLLGLGLLVVASVAWGSSLSPAAAGDEVRHGEGLPNEVGLSPFTPGSMLVQWDLKDPIGLGTDTFLSEYLLTTGENRTSSTILNTTTSDTYLDADDALFFAVLESGPLSIKQILQLAVYDISSETPTLKSTCELSLFETSPIEPKFAGSCMAYVDEMMFFVLSDQLYLTNPSSCATEQLKVESMPAIYASIDCALYGTTVAYISASNLEVVLLDVNLRQVTTVIPFPAAITDNSTIDLVPGSLFFDSNTGDLYMNFPFATRELSLWYLPHGSSEASDWVNLCSIAGSCFNSTYRRGEWQVVGLDPRFTSENFNNRCADGSKPTHSNSRLKPSPLIIMSNILNTVAYSAYTNCVVWEGPQLLPSIEGGFSIPAYNPYGNL